ncbi:hypothetical protein LOC67_16090 [Stieleria sp. JC731]|nr:hypothetical protein [Stieleria sp. JC731]MCC9602083.1 hypothetical protein [Stieleria sp. JC731]
MKRPHRGNQANGMGLHPSLEYVFLGLTDGVQDFHTDWCKANGADEL